MGDTDKKKVYAEPSVDVVKLSSKDNRTARRYIDSGGKDNYERSKDYNRKQFFSRFGGRLLDNADASGFMRVFGFIFANLLLFGLIAQLTGTETNTRTFAGFLEFIGKGTWTIPLDWLNWSSITVGGDWGVFEFFREFIQLIIAGVNAFVWLGVMILNVAGFLTQFALWLFGFVA